MSPKGDRRHATRRGRGTDPDVERLARELAEQNQRQHQHAIRENAVRTALRLVGLGRRGGR